MRIPGGRHLSVPTISSTAAAIAAISMNEKPSNQMSAPAPGWYLDVSGGYMNHPPLGDTPNNNVVFFWLKSVRVFADQPVET